MTNNKLNWIIPIDRVSYKKLLNENKVRDDVIYQIINEDTQPMAVSKKMWGELVGEIKELKKIIKEKR